MHPALLSFLSRYIVPTDDEKRILGEMDLIRSYPAGTTLVEQGQRSRESYLLIEGLVRYHCTTDGTDRTTDFFTEGDAFEPRCVAEGSASDHHVSCVEACVLWISTPEMEAGVRARLPRLETVCRLAAEESLRATGRALQRFQLMTPQQRYEHLRSTRPDLLQRAPQYMIASFLGIEPESLSRIRRRMVRT